jgi:outer membrane lipoprotein-sorting protein
MRWFLAVAMFFVALPAYAQDAEAEKLYRAMEKKLIGAKALKFSFESQAAVGDDFNLKGTILLAADNKLRLEYAGKDRDKILKGLAISDGKQLIGKNEFDGKPDNKSQETPPTMNAILAQYVARASLYMSLQAAFSPTAEQDPSKILVSDFKTLDKEKIGKRQAQAIAIKVQMPNQKAVFDVKLWIDLETHLPLKRVVEFRDGTEVTMRLSETYTQMQIDPPIKGQEFVLPK